MGIGVKSAGRLVGNQKRRPVRLVLLPQRLVLLPAVAAVYEAQRQPAVNIAIDQYIPLADFGIRIQLTATVAQNNTYAHYNWVQMVTTNDPLGGNPANTPYIDKDPGQLTSYYLNPQEQAQFEQTAAAHGASTTFYDQVARVHQGRGVPNVVWHSHLALVGIKGNVQWHTLRTIGYGFTIDAGGVHMDPVRIPY